MKNEKINDENLNNLNTGIGDKEITPLSAKPVLITDLGLEKKGVNDSKILVCSVKHPDSNKTIKISGVEWLNPAKKKIEMAGLWFNLDEDKKIRKGSALASFLQFLKCETISDLMNKEVLTILDGSYLIFKGY